MSQVEVEIHAIVEGADRQVVVAVGVDVAHAVNPATVLDELGDLSLQCGRVLPQALWTGSAGPGPQGGRNYCFDRRLGEDLDSQFAHKGQWLLSGITTTYWGSCDT